MFVDLTATYDTVWHRGLTCKLLHLLPYRHMVKMFMKLVTNRSFTLTTRSGTTAGYDPSKNGVPQGSVLAPFYITSTPTTCRHQSRRNILMRTILHFCWRLAGRRRSSIPPDLVARALSVKNGVSCLPSEQQGGRS